MRAAPLFTALALAGCGDELVVLARPPGVDPNGALVVLLSGPRGTSAHAAAAGGTLRASLEDARTETRVVALSTPPLEQLGLRAGELSLGLPSSCPLEEALTPSGRWSLDGDSWTPITSTAAHALLGELRVASKACASADPRCLPFHIRVVPFEGPGRSLFLTPLPEGLLLGTFSRSLYLLDRGVQLRRVSVPAGIDSIRGAMLTPRGELYVSDNTGRVLRASLSPELTLSATVAFETGTDYVARMVPAGTSTGGARLLTLSSDGALGLGGLGDRSWRVLHAFDRPDENRAIIASLLERAPSDVLVGYNLDRRSLRVTDGVVRLLPWTSLTEPIDAMIALPGVGPVAFAGETGRLYRFTTDRWTLGEPVVEFGLLAQVLAIWRGSLFVAGTTGQIRQLLPGEAFCPASEVRGNRVRAMEVLDDTLVAVVGHGDDNELWLIDAP